MIDPLTALDIGERVYRLAKCFNDLNGAATARLRDAYTFSNEVAAQDAQQLARLRELFGPRIEDLERQVGEMCADPQSHRVRRNYYFEASREATDERWRMLAFAAAGSVAPNLTIAQIARVERTIRDLDAADLRLLDALTEIKSEHSSLVGQAAVDYRRQEAGHRYELWNSHQPSGYLLATSGCVYVQSENVWGETTEVLGAHVTPLGEWVLEVMNGYLRASEPNSPPASSAKGGA